MFAVMPLTSPKHVAVLRSDPSGSHGVSLVDAALIVVATAFALATLAPSVALAMAVVARASSTQISFAR